MRHAIWRGCRSGLLVAALALGAGAARADDLTDKVLQVFRAQAAELRVTARTDNELEVTGQKGPHAIYLFNLRAACASSQSGCDEAVLSFVQRVAMVVGADRAGASFSSHKAFAVLRNAGFGKQIGEKFKEPNKQLVVLPFVEGVEVLFVVDGERAMRFINQGDMADAGLTEASLLDLAARNATQLPPLRYEPLKDLPGVYFMPANDGLGTARAFDAALWQKLEAAAGGPVAMAMPTRDWVFFARADNTQALATLRALLGRVVRGEPYAVSAGVMVRNGAGWKLLPAP